MEIAGTLDFAPLQLEYADEQIDSSVEYSKFRIPFASSTRQQICIDLEPTESGFVGQIIFIDSEYKVGIFLTASLTEFLERYLEDITQGRYKPSKASEDFLTCDIEISLSNWQWSKRWQHVPYDRSLLAPFEE